MRRRESAIKPVIAARLLNHVRRLGCAGCLFLLAGCATPRVDWDSRVGVLTFDQAVGELGPPDKSVTMEGGTRVADWIDRRRGAVTFGLGVGSYGRHGGIGVGTGINPHSPDRVLRLTFGPDGKLAAWKRN